jgi:hypothetical protein
MSYGKRAPLRYFEARKLLQRRLLHKFYNYYRDERSTLREITG